MTQEEKQLLLKDLSARLSYGVKFQGEDSNVYTLDAANYFALQVEDVVFKPYLRPMSSMTDGELKEFGRLKYQDNEIWEIVEMLVVKHDFLNIKCRNRRNGVSTWIFQISRSEPLRSWKGIDWLNKHHFDYRRLIEKGLALKAPKGMYKNE